MIRDGGLVLLCQRPPEKAQGGKWEFPGGKIEPGETGPEALVRECREELDVRLDVGEALADVVQDYPGKRVHLTLYAARIAAGEPRMLEHSDMRWVPAKQIHTYDLCPADARLVEILQKKEPSE